jgi:hypothetical protein
MKDLSSTVEAHRPSSYKLVGSMRYETNQSYGSPLRYTSHNNNLDTTPIGLVMLILDI